MFAQKTIVLALLLCSLLGFNPQSTTSAELPIIPPITKQYIQEQVEYFSEINGVDPKLISKVIECESQNNHKAKGDGGKAFGVMQYHKQSFENHAKLYGEKLDYYSAHDQIKLGTWAIANGKGREWTAYRAIKNGGTYSFYSKMLKRHFTVKCKL